MPVDIEGHLHDLAVQLDRLKVLYEQYFIGLEKLPPTVPRREVEKLLAFLGAQNIGNTGVRFRYLGLVRRWKTYAERWDKILRDIENGTYPRHLARAKRRGLSDEAAAREARRPVGLVEGAGEKEAAPEGASPPSNGRPRAADSPVPGMSDVELRALHRNYQEALRTVGDAREVRFEGLVASLRKQVPDILKKNRCELLSFNVAVKEGKVILRATPRRSPEPDADGKPEVKLDR